MIRMVEDRLTSVFLLLNALPNINVYKQIDEIIEILKKGKRRFEFFILNT